MNLLEKLNKEFEGWLEWEPETIRTIIIDEDNDFNTEIAFNKIMALQTVINSQADDEGVFFNDWQIFEKIVLALNEIIPNFADLEGVEPHEIHFAYKFLEDIKGKVEFNDEVKKYIAACYKNNNIVHCPFYEGVDELLEGNDELSAKVKKYYHKIPWDEDKAIEKIAGVADNPVTVQVKRIIYIIQYAKER